MKKQRKQMRRGIAWVLALSMVVSSFCLSGVSRQAKAAAASYDLSVKSGSSSGTVSLAANQYGKDFIGDVLFDIPTQAQNKSALSAYGITSMEVKVTIHSFSGSNPGVMLYVQPDASGSWEWNQTDTTVLQAGNQITLTYDFSDMNWNGGDTIGYLGMRFADSTDGTSISYTIDSAKLIASGTSSGSGEDPSSSLGIERDYSSGVTATVANQGTPSNDWSGFDMTITNNSGSTICDWIVVLQVPTGTASAFKCWNATFVADGDTIYLYPMQSGANAVVSTGTMVNYVPGGGFAGKYVDASNIQVKAVYYNKGSQSGFDYSSGETNDNNSGSGGSSSTTVDTSTNKDLVVEYNYAKVLQESLYFYDANMCGNGVDENCGLSWRGDCHTDDDAVSVTVNGTTYKVDVSGGFHDAGDHVKFGLPQGYAASALGMSYYEFKEAYTDLGQEDHLQTITDYFCDYFKRSTIYSDNNNRTGGVVAFCYQVGEGNADHGYWGVPENQTGSRPAYFATSSNPATDEVSLAIAALAINYINFGNQEDLQVAKDLFTFVKNNSKSCATEGAGSFYESTSWQDDYSVAAAALYAATGDTSYQQEYYNNKSGINTGWLMDWANSGAMAAMLMKDWSILKQITDQKNTGVVLDGVYNCISNWGSCRYNAAMQFCGLVYDKGTGSSSYTSWAESQMRYIIGENPNKRCYIVGYNENSSKYPHHRAASRSSNATIVREDHYTLLGALVGGPKQDGTYVDDQNDYVCNEVALDYSVGLVGASAGLYLATKGSTAADHSEALASATELSDIGVTKTYETSVIVPTVAPTATPTVAPTATPTVAPTVTPTTTPTVKPTATPTVKPTATPTVKPTATPTVKPTATPTVQPTATPTVKPTATPTVKPTATPTVKPTATPTVKPTATPTVKPTATPTVKPTTTPTVKPTTTPTVKPTATPTVKPTATPTVAPTATPTVKPTATPTVAPTVTPTVASTSTPEPSAPATVEPTIEPTSTPTANPTTLPIATPTVEPSAEPTAPVEPSPSADVTPTAPAEPSPSADVTPTAPVVSSPSVETTPTAPGPSAIASPTPTTGYGVVETSLPEVTVVPLPKRTIPPVPTATTGTTSTVLPTATPDADSLETTNSSGSSSAKDTENPVTTKEPVPTANVTPAFEKSEYTIYVTEELQLEIMNLSDATNITYASSDIYVAEVDENGLLKAKKAGVVTVTATLSNKKQLTCQITVAKPAVKLKKTTITLKKKKTAKIQFKQKLASDGIKKCSVIGKKVVKVSKNGLVKGLKKGKATIKITMKSGVVVKCKVKVK